MGEEGSVRGGRGCNSARWHIWGDVCAGWEGRVGVGSMQGRRSLCGICGLGPAGREGGEASVLGRRG